MWCLCCQGRKRVLIILIPIRQNVQSDCQVNIKFSTHQVKMVLWILRAGCTVVNLSACHGVFFKVLSDRTVWIGTRSGKFVLNRVLPISFLKVEGFHFKISLFVCHQFVILTRAVIYLLKALQVHRLCEEGIFPTVHPCKSMSSSTYSYYSMLITYELWVASCRQHAEGMSY